MKILNEAIAKWLKNLNKDSRAMRLELKRNGDGKKLEGKLERIFCLEENSLRILSKIPSNPFL